MKQTLLFLSAFIISLSVFAQNTVNITSAQYAAQKQNGQLDPTTRYIISDANSFTPVPFSGPSRIQSPICSCLIPLDSTFMIAMAPNDDMSSNLISIPFSFTFYGVSYNSLYINNNGNISFAAPYGVFTANPFPDATYNMIAPFWGDVDTRDSATWGSAGSIGNVYYKITPTAMIVKWEAVGYYAMHGDKLNTFQLIITDGTDALLPAGTNVGFCYGDMQWTTGDASSGMMGFGGAPATVGNNMGNGTDYFQAGTFDHPGSSFDGPYASADGIDWLDNQGMYFDASLPGNMPPVIINNNICDTIDVYTGDTLRSYDFAEFTLAATTPEINQTVTAVITSSDPSALTVNQTMNSSTYKQFDCTFSAVGLSTGLHYVTITATDNGSPALSASRTIVIRTHYDASVATGISENNSPEGVKIYPNPATNTITINQNFAQDSNPYITLTDVLGKTVLNNALDNNVQTIDIGKLPQGIYFATIFSKEGKSKTMKIVKK
ncbi:MAG: hypothetical protein K0Q95_1509 [Bacteroidota bacterium]|jgi:hypothetical protein|nr:hypothetical protein [Bacteroidota bacterium]